MTLKKVSIIFFEQILNISLFLLSDHWVMSNNDQPFQWGFFKHLTQFSPSVMSDSLRPHGLKHTRLPCLSTTPGAYSNSCPSSQWCHPTISSSVHPFSSCLQSFPASGSFPMIRFFTSGGQSIGASASVLPMNIQGWCPLGLTGLDLLAVFFWMSFPSRSPRGTE